MTDNMRAEVLKRFEAFPGNVSLYYKNIVTGEELCYNEDFQHIAASVIKIPIMVELFRRFGEGSADPADTLPLRAGERVPSCGVLKNLHEGLEVTLGDLVWPMITISDNMATNMLIDHLSIEAIQATIDALGLNGVRLERKLFETRPGLREKNNRISAQGIAVLLEGIYKGEVVSEEASKSMLAILLDQQLKNKLPRLLPRSVKMAHKTGEDGGITHDCGIVMAREPYIACFCSSEVDEVSFNELIGEINRDLYMAIENT